MNADFGKACISGSFTALYSDLLQLVYWALSVTVVDVTIVSG